MRLEIRPCTEADLARHEAAGASAEEMWLHRARADDQAAGESTYLLAWDGERLVGWVSVLRESKYADVRAARGDFPEMNGLEARPTGRGTGTTLVRAAEELARAGGASRIGLAVGPVNTGARRLYERLGYREWGGPEVVDHWTERDGSGAVVAEHADRCRYLLRDL